jgi:hypothetical protein
MTIIDFARAQAAKRARHLRHPQLCLDAIQEGVAYGGAAGLKKVGSVRANCVTRAFDLLQIGHARLHIERGCMVVVAEGSVCGGLLAGQRHLQLCLDAILECVGYGGAAGIEKGAYNHQ